MNKNNKILEERIFLRLVKLKEFPIILSNKKHRQFYRKIKKQIEQEMKNERLTKI